MHKNGRINQAGGHFGSTMAISLLSLAFLLNACTEECDCPLATDNFPPTPPDGVYSITGDGVVTLYWNPNREPDLAGYEVWWNDQAEGFYEYLASVPKDQNWYEDYQVTNGVTKFYAVLAYDVEGWESALSYEIVFDTPRPEGEGLVLFDYLGQNGHLSGYDFSSLSGTAQDWNDPTTDVYFGTPNGVKTLFADSVGVDVQDYGTIDLLDVDWAPLTGWSPSRRVELIPGHSYIVRIAGVRGQFNYAKIYVAQVTDNFVILDWAYQAALGNRELSPGGG